MIDSQLILELLFLQRRGGCSLTVLLFFLMLVGTCCFILSASLCVVRPKYRASHQQATSFLFYVFKGFRSYVTSYYKLYVLVQGWSASEKISASFSTVRPRIAT